MGFTHVEVLPITEHPFFASWGYQVTGYFAPTSRFGTPQDFMFLVDTLHQHGIGLILDWVPSHFATDDFSLSVFDGTHLFEHADSRQGFHPDWGSFVFNYGRHEVRSFLLSSGLFWLDKYHIDGLRVDAVASMLYLDYSRKDGGWIPNQYGGKENIDAISFLRRFNEEVYRNFPDVQTHAEESTAWAMVSRPTYVGGLGFGYKWDMGWMHDTLKYFQFDPVHRQFHQNDLTFRMLYAYNENFILPLSHDEVVHGKGPLWDKMSGDEWQKYANLRLLFAYQWAMTGKKLLFMGGEIAQRQEWRHDASIDWHLLKYAPHQGVQSLVRDLNSLYQAEPAHPSTRQPAGRLRVDRLHRCSQQRDEFHPAGQDHRRHHPCGVELHTGPAPGLSHRRAGSRFLAGDLQYGRGSLRGNERRQQRRGLFGIRADAQPEVFAAPQPAPAGRRVFEGAVLRDHMIGVKVRHKPGTAGKWKPLVDAALDHAKPHTYPLAEASEGDVFSLSFTPDADPPAFRVFVGTVLVGSTIPTDRVLPIDYSAESEADTPPLVCQGRILANCVGFTELTVRIRFGDVPDWHLLLTLPLAVSAGKIAMEQFERLFLELERDSAAVLFDVHGKTQLGLKAGQPLASSAPVAVLRNSAKPSASSATSSIWSAAIPPRGCGPRRRANRPSSAKPSLMRRSMRRRAIPACSCASAAGSRSANTSARTPAPITALPSIRTSPTSSST